MLSASSSLFSHTNVTSLVRIIPRSLRLWHLVRGCARYITPRATPAMTSQGDHVHLEEYLDIPYAVEDSRTKLREFDLYVPTKRECVGARLRPLVCFVHGGAWRSEDKAEHAGLARRLAVRTGFPVAVPNYRLTTLSTPIRHPAHAEDLLSFLQFILTWSGPHTSTSTLFYDPTRLYLIGHSCAAHMLTSIFLQPPEPVLPASPVLPSPPAAALRAPSPPPSPVPTPETLSPSMALLAATRALIMSEGLYDLDALLTTYPAYKTWFIAPTFGRLRSYAPWNTASYSLRLGGEHLRWLILHSRGDTLVNQEQSEQIWKRLTELHRQDRQRVDADGVVRKELEVLTEEHNDMLAGGVYPQLVGDYILANSQRQESAGRS